MTTDFVTKDSGERVHFDSGMQRDVSTDKLRVDLAIDGPLFRYVFELEVADAFHEWYENGGPDNAATVLRCIASDEGIDIDDLFARYIELMKRGADKYTDRNWMQANGEAELARFRESACRHFWQWLTGDRDEDHAAAVWFNMNGAEYVLERMGS